MGRKRKVNPFEALELVGMAEPISYGDLVQAITEENRCSERTAENTITVLRRARYVETEPVAGDSSSPYDLRRTFYRVSDRGARVLDHPEGPFVLHAAWRLFTGTPSAKNRRYQARVAADRGLEREFARIEKNLLVPVEQLYRPIPNMPWVTTTENWRLL